MLAPQICTINTSLGSTYNNAIITVYINDSPIQGILDTAAQITVINRKCLQRVKLKISKQTVQLKQADGTSALIAYVIPNVSMKVGNSHVQMTI